MAKNKITNKKREKEIKKALAKLQKEESKKGKVENLSNDLNSEQTQKKEKKKSKKQELKEQSKRKKERLEKEKQEIINAVDEYEKNVLKQYEVKNSHYNLQILELFGARIINGVDYFLDKLGNSLDKIWPKIEWAAATLVFKFDKYIDIINWAVTKNAIFILRKVHDFRVYLSKIRVRLMKNIALAGIVCAVLVILYASVIDYEYSYNGKTLGVVNEQSKVTDILELVSAELTDEYNVEVKIDAERDISFKPILSINKDVDSEDDVLKKFSCLGEINVAAYAITADGKTITILDTKEHAEEVIENVKNYYIDDSASYEEIGFVEDVEVCEIQTTLDKITNVESAEEYIRTSNTKTDVYTVQLYDTLEGICEKFDMTLSELYKINPDYVQGSEISIGQEFKVISTIPLLTLKTVRVAELAEAIPYETEYVDSSSYYMDTYFTVSEGSDGRKKVTARVTEVNGEETERDVLSTEILVEPTTRVVAHGTKPIPARVGTGTFIRPIKGYYSIGSRYGYRLHPIKGAWILHSGIDIQTYTGAFIYASDGGTVVKARWNDSYGWYVEIDHGGLYHTLYAHCSQLLVSEGEKVYQEQIIALVGSTGDSTGPHCHFEIMYNGVEIDPETFVSF